MDKRFLVYILGRGVPPSNNNTFRWCTRQIKIEPMAAELERLFGDRGEKVLLLTGVRQGESAIRDGRIAMSCGKNGAECGQGWYQETMPEELCDTLAPLLHWRVCHVWEWLKHWAPQAEFGDWSTQEIADAYGGDEAEEINARTGCVGLPPGRERHGSRLCDFATPMGLSGSVERAPPVVARDAAAEEQASQAWARAQKGRHLLEEPATHGGRSRFAAREMALDRVLAIQSQVNAAAKRIGRPEVDMLDAAEVARVRELIAAKTWPEKWDGSEPTADVLLDSVFADGTCQPLLGGVR